MSRAAFALAVAAVLTATATAGVRAGWHAATVQSARCQHLAVQLGMRHSAVKLDEPDGCLVWTPMEDACASAADTEQAFRLDPDVW